jgi:transposase-like protein
MRRHQEEQMGRKSNYSESYKREAVAKAEASGNVSQTARELGISNKTLHAWIKQYGEPLDVDSASVKELSARVRQLERQLAMREGQIEVLKKAIGMGATPRFCSTCSILNAKRASRFACSHSAMAASYAALSLRYFAYA